MDPVAVVAASFALLGGIVKTTTTIAEVSVELRDVPDDVDAINRELQALQSLLGPVSDSIARFGKGSKGDESADAGIQDQSLALLLQQVENTLSGALAVVNQIEATLRRYKGGGLVWTRLKWVMFGSGQLRKLRMSLESYKVALGIGLHVMSISIVGDIKGDTEVLRDVAEVIKLLQTDDVLARLETHGKPSEARNKVENWLDRMADYTSYAETAYQATTVDPEEYDREWAAIIAQNEKPEPIDSQPTLPSLPNVGLLHIQDVLSATESVSDGSVSQDRSGGHLRQHRLSPFSSTVGGLSTQDLGTTTDITVFSSSPTLPKCSIDTPSVKVSPAPQAASPYSEPDHAPSSVIEPEGSKAAGVDWSPLVPEFLSTAEFQTLKDSVQRDNDAILKAQEARHHLSLEDRERLDGKLLHAAMGSDGRSSSRRSSRCEALFNRGAIIGPDFWSAALIQSIERRDSRTLAVLLRYGLDPEGQGTPRDARRPLSVAASRDVACLAALLLAGAQIDVPWSKDVCDTFCQSGTQTLSIRLFCSPFLAAFAAIRPYGKRSTDIRQFWVCHFLLVNGADANARTCTSALELIVRHWPITSQRRITNHLLGFRVDLSSPEVNLQFRYAVEAGVVDLVQLLLENGVHPGQVSSDGSPSQDPVVLAAEGEHWGCLSLIVEGKQVDDIHLFSLVHVYMLAQSKLTWESFCRAVRVLLSSATDSGRAAKKRWKYLRETGLTDDPYEYMVEYVTALEFVEKVANKNTRDRDEVALLFRTPQERL